MAKEKSVKDSRSQHTQVPEQNDLFDRVVSILEQARGNVVRAINSNMVMAYWLIGREIVQELQGGEQRAGYGKQVITDLSKQLTERHGKGFSETTLQYWRRFYLTYPERGIQKRSTGSQFKEGGPNKERINCRWNSAPNGRPIHPRLLPTTLLVTLSCIDAC